MTGPKGNKSNWFPRDRSLSELLQYKAGNLLHLAAMAVNIPR